MTTIKAYTDISQSKVLAEILPMESADMFYAELSIDGNTKQNLHPLESYGFKTFSDTKTHESKRLGFIPAWSLAALLKLMPKIGSHEPMLRKLYYLSEPTERYICQYSLTDMTSEYDNPVGACVETIIKLHGLNLL